MHTIAAYLSIPITFLYLFFVIFAPAMKDTFPAWHSVFIPLTTALVAVSIDRYAIKVTERVAPREVKVPFILWFFESTWYAALYAVKPDNDYLFAAIFLWLFLFFWYTIVRVGAASENKVGALLPFDIVIGAIFMPFRNLLRLPILILVSLWRLAVAIWHRLVARFMQLAKYTRRVLAKSAIAIGIVIILTVVCILLSKIDDNFKNFFIFYFEFLKNIVRLLDGISLKFLRDFIDWFFNLFPRKIREVIFVSAILTPYFAVYVFGHLYTAFTRNEPYCTREEVDRILAPVRRLSNATPWMTLIPTALLVFLLDAVIIKKFICSDTVPKDAPLIPFLLIVHLIWSSLTRYLTKNELPKIPHLLYAAANIILSLIGLIVCDWSYSLFLFFFAANILEIIRAFKQFAFTHTLLIITVLYIILYISEKIIRHFQN